MKQQPVYEFHTDQYLYRQYCAEVKKMGGHVVRFGDRVSVVLDVGGTGWTASWDCERRSFADSGRVA